MPFIMLKLSMAWIYLQMLFQIYIDAISSDNSDLQQAVLVSY